ncbi:hypothetical protein NDU88_002134 [Pleurodeles waltl]|uniref:Uncharacterized protein n=1 Tax=Pleurodeles waltl TaxID=8319 RepID=A0AAV7KUP4_PLEWA|nr:hypothetical protein NDU88_002134 [Pleurodeles waltl]
MVDYLERWLGEEVVLEGHSSFYALERVHRVPAKPLQSGLLYYKERNHILGQDQQQGEHRVEISKVMIFPVFPSDVQRQHSTFLEAKKHLHQIDLSCAIPARLGVATPDGVQIFQTPQEVWNGWTSTHFWTHIFHADKLSRKVQSTGPLVVPEWSLPGKRSNRSSREQWQ